MLICHKPEASIDAVSLMLADARRVLFLSPMLQKKINKTDTKRDAFFFSFLTHDFP